MLPPRAWVDQEAMARKGYSASHRAPSFMERHQIIQYQIQDTRCGVYPSLEMQSVYSTVAVYGATCLIYDILVEEL